ncbi:DUF3861 domain-containing protein [Marilutibacter chinensis]|uniref:DUF3861 domain-containing protein n=1 Tax=Marilutibacter chinensis TaxID=2912247 RepID=A0ABS9HQ61_9GAMM|nr:DUF3861 domain-containing protein [Lysobacter chinensis]MCF7221086.1 DUF3861 domain-containing protein [Lysobacter chinensis]
MAKREHRYRITVEHLAAPRGGMLLHDPLVFEDGNHDDLFRIVGLQRDSGRFASEDEAAAFAVGLKLLSEAVLRNRDDPLLQSLKPALGAFIGKLKAVHEDDGV